MTIKINGKETVFEGEQLTVKEVLRQSKVQNVEMVSVQLNGSFVPDNQLDTTILSENDEIDFLYFMGGGSKQLIFTLSKSFNYEFFGRTN